MESIIKELWHGNIIPQEDSRTNSKEMKELLGYMSRHHEDLEKSFTDEQKEIFEKFHDCWSEYMSLAEAAIFEYAFKLGMQIAIDLKRGTDPDKLMTKLYKMTPLEDSFSCNFNVLIGGVPKTLGVREILLEWTAFRTECVKRGLFFEINKKKERLS